jgi:TRAP-type C4-dicarboxylate transport system permease small subunit
MEPWKKQIGYALIWISVLFFFIMMIVSSVKVANNTKRTITEFQNEIHIPYYAFLSMFGAGSLIILTKIIEEGSSSSTYFEVLIALTASAVLGISLFIVSMSTLSMLYKA